MSGDIKELNRKEMGARIRARREALQMTRNQLAERLSVTGKFIADIEYGHKGVSIDNLYKITQILDISADFLLRGDDGVSSGDARKKILNENILGALSVCSEKQLGCMEQIARLYVEGIVDRE